MLYHSCDEYVGSPQGHSSYFCDVGHYFLLAIYDTLLELNCCGTAEVLGEKIVLVSGFMINVAGHVQLKSLASVSLFRIIGAPMAVSWGRLCTYFK